MVITHAAQIVRLEILQLKQIVDKSYHFWVLPLWQMLLKQIVLFNWTLSEPDSPSLVVNSKDVINE